MLVHGLHLENINSLLVMSSITSLFKMLSDMQYETTQQCKSKCLDNMRLLQMYKTHNYRCSESYSVTCERTHMDSNVLDLTITMFY